MGSPQKSLEKPAAPPKALKDSEFEELVRSTSRSFSLTLRALPQPQRDAVALAYLLARYADTLTDSGNWDVGRRTQLLNDWEAAITRVTRGESFDWRLTDSVGSFNSPEAHLLLHGEAILTRLSTLDSHTRETVAEVLKTLVSAMRWDLKTFENAWSKTVVLGIKDEPLLDWYCYSIAGCVGEFWVRIFGLPQDWESFAVAYGKGLQRINVFRDSQEDWSRGRMYLPTKLLPGTDEAHPPWGLEGSQWKDFSKRYIEQTRILLHKGLQFCDLIPRRQWRLRFASALPALIGLETLKVLEQNHYSPGAKIARPVVYKMMRQALLKVILFRKFLGS